MVEVEFKKSEEKKLFFFVKHFLYNNCFATCLSIFASHSSFIYINISAFIQFTVDYTYLLFFIKTCEA